MPIDLKEIRKVFFEESFENLEVMESSLLELDIGAIDLEQINNVFRVVHSIKGGAGIFDFEHIISFAHVAETLLDEMRNEEHVITQSLVDLLLQSVDVMRMMLSALQENTDYDIQKVQSCQTELQNALNTPMEGMLVNEEVSTIPAITEGETLTTPEEKPLITPEEEPLITSEEEPLPSTTGWHIVFKPEQSILKTGNDPINLFRELANFGHLEVKVDTSQVPAFADFEPHSCYLNWDIILYTQIERATIEEVFEWVEDECELHITALEAKEPEEKSSLESENAEELPLDKNEKSPVDESNIEAAEAKKTAESSLDESNIEAAEAKKTAEESNIEAADAKKDFFDESNIEAAKAEKSSLDESNIEPVIAKAEKSSLDETKKVPQKSNKAIPPVGKGEPVRRHATKTNSIRVSIDKIDILINMVGELVITQSMLEQIGGKISDSCYITQLRDGLSQLERNTRELQESVMRIRMLPISFSFNRFPRLVHDLSLQLDKQVELKLSGEHTELDKTVLEKMSDPLVHLVRNALDHGIETPAQRRAAGKPEIGQINLHAFHQGGNIIIQISDDGAGFDLEKIRAKAIQKDLLNPKDNPTDEQLYDFIFQPGFSTVTQVSDLSGRGVGMDVVRRNIRALGGTIEVSSKLGVGSTFSIRLPLTLAILDGQLVRVGQYIYILSLLSIIESLRVKPALVSSLVGCAEVYRLRDEYIPILRLYELFDITPSTTKLDKGLLVIAEGDGKKIGLFVDELLSQQQIVIKSLESNYKKVQGISAATILGDGSVALILDVAGLIQRFQC